MILKYDHNCESIRYYDIKMWLLLWYYDFVLCLYSYGYYYGINNDIKMRLYYYDIIIRLLLWYYNKTIIMIL